MGRILGQELKAELSKNNFNNFVNNVIYQKVQIPLKKKLSKVYPLRELGIRYVFLKQGDVAEELKRLDKLDKQEVIQDKVEDVSEENNYEENNSEAAEDQENNQTEEEN